MKKHFTLLLLAPLAATVSCSNSTQDAVQVAEPVVTQEQAQQVKEIATLTKPAILETKAQPVADPHKNQVKTTKPEAKTTAGLPAKEELDKIEADLRKTIEENPESAKAHAALAGFLLSSNQTAASIPAYQTAITMDSQNPKLYAALSIAYLHQGKFSMSRAMADEALRIDPSLTQVKKINEYIDKKQEVITQAQKADAHSELKSFTQDSGNSGS